MFLSQAGSKAKSVSTNWFFKKKLIKPEIDRRNEISDEMVTAAMTCTSQVSGLVNGQVGRSLFYIANEKKTPQPYAVLYNVSKCKFVYCYDKCDQFKAFKICSHTVAKYCQSEP